jgi:hypothetical protein
MITVTTGRYVIREDGAIFSKLSGVRLCPQDNGRGYMFVYLNSRKAYVHRLVARFILNKGETLGGLQVNHINGDRTDNRADNLEIVTAKENTAHRINVLGGNTVKRTGRPVIRTNPKTGEAERFTSVRKAAAFMKISHCGISRACSGKQATAAGCEWRYENAND